MLDEDRSETFGWAVVALGFAVDSLAKGGKACYLPMVLVFEKQFGWSRSQLSILAALVHVFISFMTPISGLLIDKYPPHLVISAGLAVLGMSFIFTSLVQDYWHVVLAYGVMSGIGFGSLNLNVFSTVVIRTIPKEKQGLAIGITNAGSTFGQFAMMPLFVLFIGEYGWRLAYILLASLALFCIIPSFLLLRRIKTGSPPPLQLEASEKEHNEGGSNYAKVEREEQVDIPPEEDGIALAPTSPSSLALEKNKEDPNLAVAVGEIESGSGDSAGAAGAGHSGTQATTTFKEKVCKLCSSYSFVAVGVAFFICGVTTTGFLETHLVALVVQDGGMSSLIAAISFSVLSACNGAGMILSGHLSDRVSKEYLLAVIFIVRAMTYLMLLLTFPTPGGMVSLFVFAAVFGLVDYSVIPPTIGLVNAYVPEMVGFAVGVLLMCHSAGAAVGAAAGGWIFESASNYDYALLGCAILCIFAGFSCISAKEKPAITITTATQEA
jgi:MFS family permease